MLNKWLFLTRFLVALAVLGCFILATALFLFGITHSFDLFGSAFSTSITGKKLAISAIELVDLFLLATVFYITAIGLYELFIDDTIPVPAWLEIHTLDDLKVKLLGVVVTVLGVVFLGQVVAWDGEQNLQPYGFAVASVIAAITFYTKKK